MKRGVPFREESMTIERELDALSRSDTSHLLMKRLEQLVWERVSLNEEHVQQRRVRSSVLIISIAVAFVGGVIMGGHHQTDARTRALLVDDMELLLPAAIN
jgi:predicted PP-loop superfamily ATPase